ncbi:putative ribonuclease H-like domain-containing protein, partial [Tanacetum coccineum]
MDISNVVGKSSIGNSSVSSGTNTLLANYGSFKVVTVEGILFTKVDTITGGTSGGMEARLHKWDDKKIKSLKNTRIGARDMKIRNENKHGFSNYPAVFNQCFIIVALDLSKVTNPLQAKGSRSIQKMTEQDSPLPTITAMKIPIIKKEEYDIWSMRMRQYISHTDHNLWDIIVDGDLQEEAASAGEQSSPPAPKTAKQLTAKRNQERVKSILLLAIPDEYLLKFHNVPDAKSLWAAIKSRFGGNDESKKMQRNVLKHQFENFTTAPNESLDKAYDSQIALIMRNKPDIDQTDIDDLYNNLRNTSSTKSKVKCYNCHKKGHFAKECKSGRNQRKRSDGDNGKRNETTNEPSSQVLVAQDGLGGYDWSNDFDEPVNYALMAISSSSSSSSYDNEVQNYSKQCLESFKTLQKNFDSEREKHSKAKLEIQGYELALESLESRILGHEKNELDWGEKYEFKNYKLKYREIKINNLKMELEKVFKERDELKVKIEKWEESSKGLHKILNNQMSAKDKNGLGYGTQLDKMSNKSETDSEISISVFEVRSSDEEITPTNDRFSKADGYHAIPPPITGNFLTLRADISFAGLDEYAVRKKIIESKTTKLNIDTSKSKTRETVGKTNEVNIEKPKSVHESVMPNPKINRDKVIIEDWYSDDEDDVFDVETVSPVKTNETQTVKTQVDKIGVLTRTSLVNPVRPNRKRAVHTVSTVRPVSTARPFAPKIAHTGSAIRPIYPKMDNVRPRASYSPIKRSYYTRPAFRPKDLKQDVKTYGVKNMTTAGTRAVLNTGKGKIDNDLKKSRWVWRPKGNYMDHESKEKGYFILKKFEANQRSVLHDHASSGSGLENQLNHKVKIIRSDHGTEFKNHAMNEFCAKKGIKREFSVARTPQQNGVAERKNRTLIEAARTMLADSLLPIPFWAEAVNTACYVLRVGDPLGKFDGKSDKGYLLGYSTTSKAFRVYNKRTKRVEENMHIDFLEDQPNVARSGPDWMAIRISVKCCFQAAQEKPFENFPKDNDVQDLEDVAEKEEQHMLTEANQALQDGLERMIAQEIAAKTMDDCHLLVLPIHHCGAYDDEDVGVEAGFNNMDNTIDVSPIPTLIVHKDHPKGQILGDPKSAVQTRGKIQKASSVQQALKVWILVDLPSGKKAIGTKWVFRNKRVMTRIEAIRLFLAFASFMGFPDYQMDVKSCFLYGTYKRRLYVHQTPALLNLAHPQSLLRRGQHLVLPGLLCATQKYLPMEMMFGLGNKILLGLVNLMRLGKFGAARQIWCCQANLVLSGKFDAVRQIWCCQANLVLPGKISMANLEFVDQHNMVACLEKTEGNSDFHEIVDFLASSLIHHALTINATIDSKAVVVTEASIRSSLLFNDADGTACLTNEAIFQNLALMGYEGDFNKLTFQKALFSPQWKFLIHTILHCLSSKSTRWNEFSTNIASAVICLATNQKFNFSKLIFDGMLRNLDNTKKKFLMYPRFLMVFLNNQIELGEPFNDVYPTPAHNLKVFSNMSRKGVKFSGKVTPLIDSMLVPHQAPTGEDSRDSLEGTNGNEGDQVQTSHDSPLSGGHTSDRAEGALNLQALFVLCTNLSNMVLALESIKDAQATEITALKSRIKKLEKKCKPSISHHKAWLKNHGMEYMETEEAVDKGRQSEVSTARQDIDAARQEDSIVEPRTPPKTTRIFDDEDITMAQTLIKMKE